ncbi:MAG: preprotein translocase subunit SecG [Pacificibacter sp.]|uniref:preprotein translocase subunit SecG n=1 Tax=Pacificibacter sp. TaxID=1917866 RepID=UPI0032195045
MENVILIVHLILALCLIGIVLLQRSEGGGLGMGGGGGGDVMSGRAAASALTKLTWIFAIAFICTSIALTVLARREAASASVVDGVVLEEGAPATPSLPDASTLLPPPTADAPLAPPRAE